MKDADEGGGGVAPPQSSGHQVRCGFRGPRGRRRPDFSDVFCRAHAWGPTSLR